MDHPPTKIPTGIHHKGRAFKKNRLKKMLKRKLFIPRQLFFNQLHAKSLLLPLQCDEFRENCFASLQGFTKVLLNFTSLGLTERQVTLIFLSIFFRRKCLYLSQNKLGSEVKRGDYSLEADGEGGLWGKSPKKF